MSGRQVTNSGTNSQVSKILRIVKVKKYNEFLYRVPPTEATMVDLEAILTPTPVGHPTTTLDLDMDSTTGRADCILCRYTSLNHFIFQWT